ncbi:Uncharacterised protein [Mycobacteroides abscessus subsp. abscessus]|nr:Uncharacterised protein [Mycobacteroides abscessus subsp. abscessus]
MFGGAQVGPVVEAADLGAGALVHRDDAVAGGQVERGALGVAALRRAEQIAGRGAHAVVGVGGQRSLCGEARGVGEPGHQLPQAGRRDGRVHVDPGQVGGPAAEDAVEVSGGRDDALGPAGFVPAVAPDDAVRVLRGVFGQQGQQVWQRRRGTEVEPDHGEPGGGQVHVAVDERRRHERALEVDDGGVGVQRPADVIGTEPGHHAVADRDRGGVGRRRAVDTTAQQQRRRKGGHEGDRLVRSAGVPLRDDR